MVKHLSKALLLALLVATPVMAQQNDYRYWRDFLLGPGMDLLMGRCASGRKANARGLSNFEEVFQKAFLRGLLKSGMSLREANAMQAGDAAAMRPVCPTVW